MALLAGLGVTVFVSGGGVLITTLAALRDRDPNAFDPPMWYYATNLALTVAGALAGGFTASRITHRRSMFTVLVMALIVLMSGLAPVLRGTHGAVGQPDWYPLSLAFAGPIGVLLGGVLERRRSPVTPAVTPG
jgi:peptidoglycan/LPS O-acetylase OafA/YrhL